jgi:hypothetical protein
MDRPFPDDGRWPHPDFHENRLKAAQEILDQYENQYVAWNYEGTQILAGAADRETLDSELDALGVDMNRVVYEYLEVLG